MTETYKTELIRMRDCDLNKPKTHIGTEWRRPDGEVVRITSDRVNRGQREVELTPVSGGGRISWKWDGAVSFLLLPNAKTKIQTALT